MSSEKLPVLPVEQWYSEHTNPPRIELNHPFGEKSFLEGTYNPTPMRGFDYDRPATEPPAEFFQARDFRDGMSFWRRCLGANEGDFRVSMLLTDPSRPDGFDPRFLGDALDEFDIVMQSATRSVWHSVNQHKMTDLSAPGARLDNPSPNPGYQAALSDVIKRSGKPTLSYDLSGGNSQLIRRAIQATRSIAYIEASGQEDMGEPDFRFFVPDLVHTGALQFGLLGAAGVKLQERLDDDPHGKPLGNVLFIGPVEIGGGLAFKMNMAVEDYVGHEFEVQVAPALHEFSGDKYQADQYVGAYTNDLQQGYISLE